MSADDAVPREEVFTDLLAACDEALAAAVAPPAPADVGAPPELSPRLERGLRLLRRLQQLRAPQRSAAGSPDSPTRVADLLPQTSGRPAAPPAQVGRFTLHRELGRGGFGIVYLAHDPSLRRAVALKVPYAPALVTPELRARFRREAQAVAALDHPNVVRVYEAGEDGPLCYLVSAYCPGTTLAHWLRQRTDPVPFAQAVDLVRQLAGAVQHAHERGVLHRDLKPANVLLQIANCKLQNEDLPEDNLQIANCNLQFAIPKITDFGLAKLDGVDSYATRNGAILGTPCYMAPEQAAGKTREIGPAVDVYALGAILYELLTGRPPFEGEGTQDTLQQVVWTEPVPPSRLRPRVPADLETICLKCLQKEPAQRYAGAAALAADLGRFLDGRPVLARPVGWAERVRRWCRRRPLVAGLLAALVLALAGGGAGVLWQWQRAEWNAAENERHAEDYKRERDLAIQERRRALRHLNRAQAKVDRLAQLASQLSLGAGANHGQPHLTMTGKALLEEVVAFYEEVLREESKDPLVRRKAAEVCGRVAEIRHSLGHWKEALAARRQQSDLLRGLLAEGANTTSYRHELAISLRNRGNILRDTGQVQQARQVYRQAAGHYEQLVSERAAQPMDSSYRVELANTLVNAATVLSRTDNAKELEGLYHRAVALIKTALAADPNNLHCQSELALSLEDQGMFYWGRGERSRAEQAVREALKIRQRQVNNPRLGRDLDRYLARSYQALGIILAGTDRPQQAEECFRQALVILDQLQKDSPTVLYHRVLLIETLRVLSNLLEDQGRGPELEQVILRVIDNQEKLVEGFPAEPVYRRQLADTLMRWRGLLITSNRKQEAKAITCRVKRLYEKLVVDCAREERHRGQLVHCRMSLGTLHRHLGRYQQAAAEYRRALQLAPQDGNANNALAWLLATLPETGLKDAREAVRRARLAVAANPKCAAWWNTLGLAHYREGDCKAAVTALERSMRLHGGGNSFDGFILAMAHAKLGDPTRARQWFDRAARWMKKNQRHLEELRRFRAEALALLR